MLYTCTSIDRLTSIKDVTVHDAKRIRAVWKAETPEALEKREGPLMNTFFCTMLSPAAVPLIDKKRWVIDRILDTHGVEYLGIYKPSGHDLSYCNAGDSYANTIMFIGRRLVVGCWGDLVERGKIQEPTPW